MPDLHAAANIGWDRVQTAAESDTLMAAFASSRKRERGQAQQ